MAFSSVPWGRGLGGGGGGKKIKSWRPFLFRCAFVLPQHVDRSRILTDLTLFSEVRSQNRSDDSVLVGTGSRSGHALEVFDHGRSLQKL